MVWFFRRWFSYVWAYVVRLTSSERELYAMKSCESPSPSPPAYPAISQGLLPLRTKKPVVIRVILLNSTMTRSVAYLFINIQPAKHYEKSNPNPRREFPALVRFCRLRRSQPPSRCSVDFAEVCCRSCRESP
jgi:hypothetical protein